MIDLVAFVTQPLSVIVIALTLFIGRIILHARQLKTAAKDPDLAKIMTLGQGQSLLKAHENSLSQAKGESTGNLAQARGTLHDYNRDIKRSKQKKA